MNTNNTLLSLALPILTLVGCGWVDSTGNQTGSAVPTAGTNQPSLGNDVLFDQGAVSLNEATTTRLLLADAPINASGWTWRALNSDDAITTCNAMGGFDAAVATSRLSDACASAAD